MSTPAKNHVLRAILASDDLAKISTAIGAPTKLETKTIQLSPGRMMSEQLVSRIRDLTKLRDEIQQEIRQINVTRDPGPGRTDTFDYDRDAELLKQELEDSLQQYQDLQAKIEKAQKQIDDSKRRIAILAEILQTGFGTEQLGSDSEEFRKILGRLPTKRLQVAQKAILSQFKDQVISAVGNRKQDTIYVLLAIPKDKVSQALQSLLSYDFTVIALPEGTQRDIDSEIRHESNEVNQLSDELARLRGQQDEFRNEIGPRLNERLDEVIDALMLTRGILKIGDGREAALVYARLEKPLSSETFQSLTKHGVIELETS